MNATVIRADARDLPLADGSVDLIVTSPPYFGLRSYTDGGTHYDGQIGSEATPGEWLAALMECTREWVRVLKPEGSLFVNLGDKYNSAASNQSSLDEYGRVHGMGGGHSDGKAKGAIGRGRAVSDVRPKSLLGLPWRYALACTDQLGLILRRDIIWSKPSALPESVRDRCRSSHEYVFHLVKSPKYYSAIDEIRTTWSPGRSGSGQRSARPALTTAGNGSQAWPAGQATASSGATDAMNPRTGLPTNCSWDPSQRACTSTTCAATACASTRATSSPSPCARTCYAAIRTLPGTQPRPTASTDTHSTPSIPTSHQMASACAANACERRTGADTGGSRTLGSLPGSVWRIPEDDSPWVWDIASQPLIVPEWLAIQHFAAFPMELPRRIITGWSPRGGTVTDPFGGTGTTALVASALGRHGISVDMSADYTRLARWRCGDPGERARALQVGKPPPVHDDQMHLFEVTA